MHKANILTQGGWTRTVKVSLLALTTLMMAATALAAAPVGQRIWIRSVATGLYVSADLNRGPFAPMVADRTSISGWEQFQVIDAGGGYIALRSVGTGLLVSADLNHGPHAPLVADRPIADTWEHFLWADLAGGAFTLRGRITGRFVSADLNRGAFAPLVADRPVADTWERFTWGAVTGPTPTPTPGQGAPPGFSRLLWSDEFSGSTINTANWNFELGGGGWGNNELQNYTNRSVNARIVNGSLVIEARRESFGGNAYTSARMNTRGKRSFGLNTWVEARVRVPQGQGIWPAFWMLGANFPGVAWPGCGEIDIMEVRGQNPFQKIGTIHWLDTTNRHGWYEGQFNSPVSLAAGFHTFAISRTPSEIRWYVDRIQYHVANIAGGINGTAEFHAPFFILLNVAVGGNFVGPPNAGTVFPRQMQVDYVRVWGQ